MWLQMGKDAFVVFLPLNVLSVLQCWHHVDDSNSFPCTSTNDIMISHPLSTIQQTIKLTLPIPMSNRMREMHKLCQ
jgi:hypothetical protein